MQSREGGVSRRRREEKEAFNILKKVELKGSAAPVNTESLPVLRLTQIYEKAAREKTGNLSRRRGMVRLAHVQFTSESTGEGCALVLGKHIFAVKTGNTRKNNATADWCLHLPLELDSGPRPQSKLTSPKAATRISQLFPHEQRSLCPRSSADNCTAGQASAYWT